MFSPSLPPSTAAARPAMHQPRASAKRRHATPPLAWIVALLAAIATTGCGGDEGGSGAGGGGTDAANDAANDAAGDTSGDTGSGGDTASADTATADDTATATDTVTADDTATATDTATADDTTTEDTAGADTTTDDTAGADTAGADTTTDDTATDDTATPDTTPTDTTPSCTPTSPSDEVCDGVDNDCDGTTDEQAPCGKGEACVIWTCAGTAGCKQAPMTNGVACDDGDPCTSGETCGQIEGAIVCKGGGNACDDGNSCTTDSCTPADGKPSCQHAAVDDASATVCQPGDVCQVGTCVAGSCAAKAKCVDANPCTEDACNKTTGACTFQALKTNTPCSLGLCESGLLCNEVLKSCALKGPSYKALDCDDKDACTVDSCDQAKGCVHVAIAEGGACSDGDACTKDDVCKAGSCAGVALCDDGDPCTADVCDGAKQTCSANPVAGCGVCSGVGECKAISSCAPVACTGGLCTYGNKEGCADVVVTEVRTEPTKPTVGASAFKTLVKWNTTNFGTKALSGGFAHQLLLSDNEVWGDAGDFNITGGCTAVGQQNFIQPAPGQTVAMTMSCVLPAKASGTYYLLVRANNVQGEDDGTNNTTAGKVELTYVEQANIKAISFLPKDKPNFTAGATEKLTMVLTAENNGNAATPQIPYTMFWASTNKDPWANKLKVGQNGSLPAMQPGAAPQTISLFTQTTYGKKGSVYVCAFIDPSDTVPEWSEGDNITCVSMLYN